MYDLAYAYEDGQGVDKDEKKSFLLYQRAALNGDKQSIFEVGRCYEYGIGVSRDKDIAKVWLDKADELGVYEELQ